MARKWMRLCIASLAVILLASCSSVEEQAVDGMENAKTVFQEDAEKPNETVDKLKIFLPSGFSIEDDSDQTNILLSKGNDSYILFVNPNELPGSQLYFDLMMANTNLKIVEKDTFEQNGRFGFAAIIQSSEENFELITSIGGIKLTTISKQQNIASNLEKMMMIVRSISTD
ncbi:hypothetical protein WAX74_06200 [Psychrobacillus sp. FJAT-51614]|uniref:DUF4367 domain-containing protein n=1 Tax=Psychrobacillus mangrovi TaxID=3117745 RepID=A0ABU8F2J3_9BACI